MGKSNNAKHINNVRFIASGHNKADEAFLRGNAGLLQKLQRNIAK